MIRRAAAVVLALTISPAVLHAQDAALTVTAQSADVHKGPSTVTPVVGHASKGTVLPVVRNLGSWVEVAWSTAPERIGYVHVTMGQLNAAAAGSSSATTSTARASASNAAAPSPSTSPAAVPLSTAQRTPASGGRAVPGGQSATISHLVGVGGMVGSMSSFGATARWWRRNHLGVQVGLTRDSMTSDTAAGRVTSMQVEPGVVYAIFDRVRDYVWVRPYVGSGVSFRHATLHDVPVADPTQSSSDNSVGYRVFGGGEFTFATATQFGLSAEVGYRHVATPFPGFEPGHMSMAIVGHWYIK